MQRNSPRSTATPVFFFQAEDGIRDVAVTGVQTCALPISRRLAPAVAPPSVPPAPPPRRRSAGAWVRPLSCRATASTTAPRSRPAQARAARPPRADGSRAAEPLEEAQQGGADPRPLTPLHDRLDCELPLHLEPPPTPLNRPHQPSGVEGCPRRERDERNALAGFELLHAQAARGHPQVDDVEELLGLRGGRAEPVQELPAQVIDLGVADRAGEPLVESEALVDLGDIVVR